MISSPQISVILPVYNGEPYLRDAIDSILNQTMTEFELIIINDGSSDASARTAKSFNDERIVYLEQENKGLNPTLNIGIAMAQAPLIARMDQDDIAMPERFSVQLSWIKAHPDVSVLGSAVSFIDEAGEPTGRQDTPGGDNSAVVKNLLNPRKGIALAHPTVIMRKDVLLKAGGYNERFLNGDEMHLWLRISEISKLHILEEVLLSYRLHQTGMSREGRHIQLRSGIIARACHYLREERLPDPSVESDDLWSELYELVDEKIEKCNLPKADQARMAISDTLSSACGVERYIKLPLLLLRRPGLFPGLIAGMKWRKLIKESVQEMTSRLNRQHTQNKIDRSV